MTKKEIFLRELDTLEEFIESGEQIYPHYTYIDIIEDLRNYFSSLKVVRVREEKE